MPGRGTLEELLVRVGQRLKEWDLTEGSSRFVVEGFLTLLSPRSNDSIDGANGWNVDFGADAVCKKSVTNFPCKDARILSFVVFDLVDNFWCGYFGLATTNNARLDRTCFIVSGEREREREKGGRERERESKRSPWIYMQTFWVMNNICQTSNMQIGLHRPSIDYSKVDSWGAPTKIVNTEVQNCSNTKPTC